MLSILCVRLTKVKVGIPESFKEGWYPPKKTGSSHLKLIADTSVYMCHKNMKSMSFFFYSFLKVFAEKYIKNIFHRK